MRPYKVKHIPTGLYWQPHKYRGSHLSKNGKIYQTKVNGVFDRWNIENGIVRLICEKDNRLHKNTKDKITWIDARWTSFIVLADTPLTDWIIEEI